MTRRKSHRRLSQLLFLTVCLTAAVSTAAFTVISKYNYPGGQAILELNKLLALVHTTAVNTTVHLDIYSKTTGATNLMQDPRLARYDKDESLKLPSDYKRHSYLLTEEPDMHLERFEAAGHVKAWAGLALQLKPYRRLLNHGGLAALAPSKGESVLDWATRISPVRPLFREQVWIMQRRQ